MEPTRQQVRADARSNEFREVTARCAAEPRVVRRRIAGKRARTSWKQLASALSLKLGAAVGPRARRVALVLTAVASFTTVGALAPRQAGAQGSRKDDIVFNTRGVPLAGASVRICAMPATGQPCAPLALIYSDAALTQALSNPLATDGLGNYFFFAAPGKYMIEISGPGITTKQFPNVILPSDPTSPTFSSITTTSGISGFSLTLTGNLTVNGSASIVGNLAFGAAQLTNQTTPPGAAPSGTVNLYTKAADKRLYYKDDTGAEIGPIANTTGAQTNITNTFTADQNVDASLRIKGPSPWIDVTRYGVRALSTFQSTTASCTSGSAVVTLPGGAIDFVNGDGIVIHTCGATAPTLQIPNQATIDTVANSGAVRVSNVVTIKLTQQNFVGAVGQTVVVSGVADNTFNGTFTVASTPGANTFTYVQIAANATSGGGTVQNLTNMSATPKGILNGTTTYRYRVIAENSNGALSAASPEIVATAGPATLGLNTLTISTVSRLAGVMTVTTTAPHNLEQFAQVKLNTGDAFNFDGAFTIATVPSSTTFTINQFGAPDVAVVSGGTVQVAAHIRVNWLHVDASATRYWVYRKIGAAAYTLQGWATQQPFYDDYNWGAVNAPAYVPALPPSTAQNGYLASTIVSGAGTTSLVLANAAGNTIAGQAALHDNSVGLNTAIAQVQTNGGGALFFPPTPPFTYYLFNAWQMLPASPYQVTMLLNGGLWFNNPLVPPTNGQGVYEFDGMSGGVAGTTQFQISKAVPFGGNAYPVLFLENAGQITLRNIFVNAGQNQQHAVVAEEGLNAGGTVNLSFSDSVFGALSSAGGVPAVFKGVGFNTLVDRCLFSASGSLFYSPGAIRGSTINIGNYTGGLGIGISSFTNITILSGGIVLEDDLGTGGIGVSNFKFKNVFGESQTQAFFRANVGGLNLNSANWIFDSVDIADGAVGQATPGFDLVAGPAFLFDLSILNTSGGALIGAGNGNEPIGVTLMGNSYIYTLGVGLKSNGYFNITGNNKTMMNGDNNSVNRGIVEVSGAVRLKDNVSLFIQNTTLPTITSITAGAGGSIGTGLRNWQIVGVDDNGAYTQPGPPFAFTVVGGSQTLTWNWTGIPGFTNYSVIDTTDGIFIPGCVNVTGLSCTTGSFFSAGTPPLTSASGSNRLNPLGLTANNVTAQKLQLTELAAPAGVAGADLLYADLTAHTLKAKNNNGAAVTVAYSDAAQTWSGNQTNMALVTPAIGGGTAISQYQKFSAAVTPTSVAANSCAEQSFNPGAFATLAPSDNIYINFTSADTTLTTIKSWRVSSAGTVAITYCNFTAGAITPAAVTAVVTAWR